jgi:hypothetical protein
VEEEEVEDVVVDCVALPLVFLELLLVVIDRGLGGGANARGPKPYCDCRAPKANW